MFTYFFGFAGESNVKTYFLPVVFDKALSCVRNSFSRAVKFCLSAGAGKLPIDIEAVEQAGSRNACSDVALHKHVDARRGERGAAGSAVAAAVTKPATLPACPPKEINTFRLG